MPTPGARNTGLSPDAALVLYATASALIIFGLLAAPTPFVLLVPVGVGIGAFAFLRRRGAPDVIGLVTGVCAFPLYLAWTHPGNRFPFIMGALMVAGSGVGLYRLRRHLITARLRRTSPPR